jgi:S1-C subfamily serine protease
MIFFIKDMSKGFAAKLGGVALGAIVLYPLSHKNLSNATSPYIMSVESTGIHRDLFSRELKEHVQGTGTGFVFDKDGDIVTNYHVIKDAVNVRVNGKDVVVIGVDPRRDVAVLKGIDKQSIAHGHLSFCRRSPVVGQDVATIGDPYGLKDSFSIGIISGLGRTVSNGVETLANMIQTDASINPGNSGGPLVEADTGCVVGMNTALIAPGIGLAIPAADVENSISTIMGTGTSNIHFLGLEFMPDHISESLELPGLAIVGIVDDANFTPTSRDQFGRPVFGDILLEANGKPLKQITDLQEVLASGCKEVTLKVLRQNGTIEVVVK